MASPFLYYQTLTPRGGYLHKFLIHRVLPIYLLMVVLSVIYFILKTILAIDTPSLSEFAQSFFFGRTVVSFGWYLQCIVLIYLIYYAAAHLAIRFYPQSVGRILIILVAFGLLFFVGLCILLGLESTWYETILSFIGGVFIAANKQRMDIIWQVKRNVWLCLLLFVGFFGLSFIFGNWPFLSGTVKIFIKMVSSLAFCLCCLSAMRFVSFENPVTTFLGSHYLEIYIIQGAVYLLLRNRYWSLDSLWVYFIVGILLVMIGAYLIKPLTTSFMNTVKLQFNQG